MRQVRRPLWAGGSAGAGRGGSQGSRLGCAEMFSHCSGTSGGAASSMWVSFGAPDEELADSFLSCCTPSCMRSTQACFLAGERERPRGQSLFLLLPCRASSSLKASFTEWRFAVYSGISSPVPTSGMPAENRPPAPDFLRDHEQSTRTKPRASRSRPCSKSVSATVCISCEVDEDCSSVWHFSPSLMILHCTGH